MTRRWWIKNSGWVAASMLFAMTDAVAANKSIIERIPGPDGGYDYISVDSAAQRVFVGRDDGVMSIDLSTHTVTPRFVAGKGVAAVLIIPGGNLLLSTNGDDNTATLFERDTGKVLTQIPTGKEPDGAQYDEHSGLAFVMNGESQDVTFIDVKSAAAIATVAVGGKPEAAASDGKGHLFVNIEDKAEIAVLDIGLRKVVSRYPLPNCEEPTGLAYDAQANLLISACHNETVKLIDARSGADRQTIKIGKGADGAIFDPERRVAYVSCFDGTLSAFRVAADGKAGTVKRISTAIGARTEALDAKLGRLYLPRADYRTESSGERKRVPGTFEVLTVAVPSVP